MITLKANIKSWGSIRTAQWRNWQKSRSPCIAGRAMTSPDSNKKTGPRTAAVSWPPATTPAQHETATNYGRTPRPPWPASPENCGSTSTQSTRKPMAKKSSATSSAPNTLKHGWTGADKTMFAWISIPPISPIRKRTTEPPFPAPTTPFASSGSSTESPVAGSPKPWAGTRGKHA
jgi:hypothetical protein